MNAPYIRIPLSAEVSLWKHGFDVESLIAGTISFESVQLLKKGEVFGESKALSIVPKYLMLRHKLSEYTTFLYEKPACYKDKTSIGDLLLLGYLDNEASLELSDEAIILIRPTNPKHKEFLCKFKVLGRGRLHFENESVTATVRTQTVLEYGSMIGRYCCKIGNNQPRNSSNESDSQRLKLFLNAIGALAE